MYTRSRKSFGNLLYIDSLKVRQSDCAAAFAVPILVDKISLIPTTAGYRAYRCKVSTGIVVLVPTTSRPLATTKLDMFVWSVDLKSKTSVPDAQDFERPSMFC